MAVITNVGNEINGFEDTYSAHIMAHEENSRILLNLTNGRPKNTPKPHYNPNAPENRWPVMVHHPAHGERTVGKSTLGLHKEAASRIVEANESELKMALASGYRLEPYLKPQVVILSPEVEKQKLIDQNKELEGKFATVLDIARKQQEQLNLMEKKLAEMSLAQPEDAPKGKAK